MAVNEWDDFAEQWDSDVSTNIYADHAYGEIVKIVKLGGQRVFDFGCGTGLLTARLSDDAGEIVALDGSSKMIEKLNRKGLPNVFPIAGFLSESLIQNNTLLHQKFDLLIASSVCAFLPDYEATLPLLKSLLVPNGIYVQWDWLASDESSENGFTERRVQQALHDAGFDSISISQPFAIDDPPDTLTVLMAIAKIP